MNWSHCTWALCWVQHRLLWSSLLNSLGLGLFWRCLPRCEVHVINALLTTAGQQQGLVLVPKNSKQKRKFSLQITKESGLKSDQSLDSLMNTSSPISPQESSTQRFQIHSSSSLKLLCICLDVITHPPPLTLCPEKGFEARILEWEWGIKCEHKLINPANWSYKSL